MLDCLVLEMVYILMDALRQTKCGAWSEMEGWYRLFVGTCIAMHCLEMMQTYYYVNPRCIWYDFTHSNTIHNMLFVR